MIRTLFLSMTMIVLVACSMNGGTASELPPAPGSVDATRKTLQKNTYTVEDVGFIRTFMDKEDPVKWSGDRDDTTTMYKEFVADRKKLQLEFLTDSSLTISDSKQKYDALYSLEKDTSAAVLLNIKYADPDFSFAGSEPSVATFTYTIRGISDQQLYLRTPHSYNEQAAVVVMKKK